MYAIYQATDIKALVKAFSDATNVGLTCQLKNAAQAPGQGFLFLGVPANRPPERMEEIKMKLYFQMICTALDHTHGCKKVASEFVCPDNARTLFRLPDAF